MRARTHTFTHTHASERVLLGHIFYTHMTLSDVQMFPCKRFDRGRLLMHIPARRGNEWEREKDVSPPPFSPSANKGRRLLTST